MSEEYVTYKGIPNCDVNKQLELQKWILDPSSRPYKESVNNDNDNNKLVALSASSYSGGEQKRSTVEIQLELQQKILERN